MKICYFASPSSVHTHRWLEYMEGKGHELQVVTAGLIVDLRPSSWPVIALPTDFPGRLPRSYWRFANLTRSHAWAPLILWLWGALKVRYLLRQVKPDIVHLHYIDDLSISALLSGFHPILGTAWGSDILLQPTGFTAQQRWLFGRALSSADLLQFNSDFMRNAATRLGARPDRTCIRQWGVDLEEFRPRKEARAFRTKWRIDPSSQVILSPRSLDRPIYSIEGVLRAFHRLLKTHSDVILVQLGASSDSREQTRLRELAVELGIDRSVRWVGFLDERELPVAFTLAKVTVSLSTSDSLPTSLLEAMASGSLPIFSDVGGVGEWITHGLNGFLVRPGDPDALAQALSQALGQRDEWWHGVRARNLEIVRHRADRSRELGRAEQDYLTLLASREKRAVSRIHSDERTIA